MSNLPIARDEWLQLLESRHQQIIQLGLDRVQTVAARLNLHVWNCPVVTVAGTNGKGSTVCALESIYKTAGYQVSTYTSPHLFDFNERIRQNGQAISNERLCQAFELIESIRGDVPLTYFEMTTLAALWFFKKQMTDLLVLEVGLGGRLDAVNIVDCDVAVITGIDLDHQDYLGKTREQIAFEKAGILRYGKPLVYAGFNPPASIVASAQTLSCPMLLNGIDFDLKQPLSVLHPHAQAAALAVSLLLQNRLPVSEQVCMHGIQKATIKGRVQWIKGRCDYLFDVAHNEQSVLYLAEILKKHHYHRVHAVFSVLADKDVQSMIRCMRECVTDWYPAVLSVPRALSACALLAAFLSEKVLLERCYISPHEAFQTALGRVGHDDLIVVFGSFFTVENVMRRIE